jgi:CRP-like cAMP-binding protein
MSQQYRNRLLRGLAPPDRALIVPHLEPITLARRLPIEHPNRKIESLVFVEDGIISVVASSDPDIEVEVGLIGREGISGLAIILSNDRSPNSTYVQVAGNGHKIAPAVFRSAIAASSRLHAAFLNYAQAFMIQTAQTAVANAKAKVDQRLARWILMAHDRIDGDAIPLTHEFLALMMGIRRAGVTEAVQKLAEEGLIEADRGTINVRNRKALEKRAGSFYGVAEVEYRRLIG